MINYRFIATYFITHTVDFDQCDDLHFSQMTYLHMKKQDSQAWA